MFENFSHNVLIDNEFYSSISHNETSSSVNYCPKMEKSCLRKKSRFAHLEIVIDIYGFEFFYEAQKLNFLSFSALFLKAQFMVLMKKLNKVV